MLLEDLYDLDYKYDIENEFKNNVLKPLVEKYKDDDQSLKEIYASLCNVIWYHKDKKIYHSVSWRGSGTIVSEILNELDKVNELSLFKKDYLDFYCSGSEGSVIEWIEDFYNSKDWYLAYYDDDNS